MIYLTVFMWCMKYKATAYILKTIWARSSVGRERAAHNGYVAGSNPAGPTNTVKCEDDSLYGTL